MTNTKEQFANAAQGMKQPDINQMVMDLIRNNLIKRNIRTDSHTGDEYEEYEIDDPKYGRVTFYHKPGMGGMPMMEFRLSNEHLKALEHNVEHQTEIFNQKMSQR